MGEDLNLFHRLGIELLLAGGGHILSGSNLQLVVEVGLSELLLSIVVQDLLSLTRQRIVGVAESAVILHSLCSSIESSGSVLASRGRCVGRQFSLILVDSSSQSIVSSAVVAIAGIVSERALSVLQSGVHELDPLSTSGVRHVAYTRVSKENLSEVTLVAILVGGRIPAQLEVTVGLGHELHVETGGTVDNTRATIHVRIRLHYRSMKNLVGIVQDFELDVRTIVLPSSSVEVDVVALASLERQRILCEATILNVVVAEVETLGEVATGSEVEEACTRTIGVGSHTLLTVEDNEVTYGDTTVLSLSEVVGQHVLWHIVGIGVGLTYADGDDGVAIDAVVDAHLRIDLRNADFVLAFSNGSISNESHLLGKAVGGRYVQLVVVNLSHESSAVNLLVEGELELLDVGGQVERAILRISNHDNRSEIYVRETVVVLDFAVEVALGNTREVTYVATRT